jgi:hypothetical protein
MEENEWMMDIYKMSHRMNKDEILTKLMQHSREFYKYIHFHPNYEKYEGLDPFLIERELYFLGSENAVKFLDELLIENNSTAKVLETVVFRGNRVIDFCKDFQINNKSASIFLPLIDKLVLTITSNFCIEVKEKYDRKHLTSTPFSDKETGKMFYQLNDNWKLKTDIKYAYLYEFLVTQNNYKISSKTEYENFVRKNYNVKGRLQYDKAISERHFKKLQELLKSLIQK